VVKKKTLTPLQNLIITSFPSNTDFNHFILPPKSFFYTDILMSFAKVEANLLYIQEDELKPEFQKRLCFFSRTTDPLFIVIQLKVSPIGSEPMINDLKEIRKDKAIKKVDNWIKICFAKHQKLFVTVIDGLPKPSNPYLDFSGINKLTVYRSRINGDQIIPLIKGYFASEDLNLQFFT
jgi:hypothetical protein